MFSVFRDRPVVHWVCSTLVASQPVAGGVSQLLMTTTESRVKRKSNPAVTQVWNTHWDMAQAHAKHFPSELKTSTQKSSLFCSCCKCFQMDPFYPLRSWTSEFPIRLIYLEVKEQGWTQPALGSNIGVLWGNKCVWHLCELISSQITMILQTCSCNK